LSFSRLLRLTLGGAVLVPLATCTDFTSPSGGGVRVPIVPTFGAAANFAKALYAAAGIQYDRVRVVITRDETEILKDTTVAFTPTSPDITLPLVITANPGEVVTATLEYRSADIILYSGTQSVTTVATGAPTSAAPTPLVLVPVGPGSGAATVELSPSSGSYPTTAPLTFTATAFTPEHTAIANAIFGWSVDDASVASVSPQGVVQPTSKGGVVKVRATTLNEKFAEATITFVTPPASLAIQSGGSQSAKALDPLSAPVVVKVLDANGIGVAGATVNFAVTTGGGSLGAASSVSDASGLVSVTWTLGSLVGTQSITATAAALPNAPLTITATATERPAVALAFGQQPSETGAGAAITPAVTVKAIDDKGAVVAGFAGAVTIALDANPTSATLGGTLSVDAIAGIATFSNLTVSKTGAGYTLKASATGLTAVTSNTFTIDQTPTGLSLNAGGGQTAAIRSTLSQIVVKVADADGVGVAGVTVTFAVASGGGSLVVDNGVTDADGLARATWTLGNTVGTQSITATSSGLAGSPLTINATATALPATTLVFVQQPTAAVTNAAISPAVTVKAVDADGNVATGFTGNVSVAFETANGATLGGTTTMAAVAGVATFSNLSVNLAGSYKLTATATGLTAALSSTFAITPPPATALEFLVQPTTVIVDSIIKPAVQVRIVDANGATVTSATNAITISLYGTINASLHTQNPTVPAVNGIATFSDLSVVPYLDGVQLQATATGLTTAVSAPFNVIDIPAVARTWNGSLSSRWTDAGNWTPSGVPGTLDSVTIVSAPNIAIIDSASAANAILIQTGATLQVKSGTGYYVYTPRIYNKGTLQLTHAYMGSSIENQGTVIVDSIAVTPFFTNVGPTSKLQIISNHGTGAVITTDRLTNQGLIEMSDVGGYPAYMFANDSVVNLAGASITSTGGQRIVVGVLRNYGTINIATATSVLFQQTAGVPSLNAGTFTITGGGELAQIVADSTTVFDNTGTISVDGSWEFIGGHLRNRDGTAAGSGIFTATASQLDIDFSKFDFTMTLDEASRFPGDSLNVGNGQTVRLTGGTVAQQVKLKGILQVDNPPSTTTHFLGGMIISGSGFPSPGLEARGDVTIDSAFSICAACKMDMNGPGHDILVSIAKPFTNNGQITMSSDGGTAIPVLKVGDGTGTLTNASGATLGAFGGDGGERRIEARLNNEAGGTIIVEHDSWLRLYTANVTNVNAGRIDIQNRSTPGELDENIYSFALSGPESPSTFNNSGTINVGSNRTLYVGYANTLNNSGTIGGKGTLDVTSGSAVVANTGKFEPGGKDTVGTMVFMGNFNVGSGSVNIDIATPSSADLFQVTGEAKVGGIINVNALPGFVGPAELQVITGAICTDPPTVQPSASWEGYNDGCYYIRTLTQAPRPMSLKPR
jgi:hypothetical protein